MFENYAHQDMEQWIIGYFSQNNDKINDYPRLQPEHFLWEEHRNIFKKMQKCNEKAVPFLPSNLGIKKKEDIDYFAKCTNSAILVVDVKPMIEKLITDSEKYNALLDAYQLTQDAEENDDLDVFEIISKISTTRFTEHQPTSTEDMMKELYEKMDGKVVGISTGIESLDENMNSFQNGRLYIVGARSGMGKSAFMCSCVEKIEQTKRVGIISLEMLDKELLQRIACVRGNIPHWKIEKGKCSDAEANLYHEQLNSIKNVFINDQGGMTRVGVITAIRQLVKKQRCDIVFVDHIGLIRIDGRSNLAHEIGENTAALKALAKELNIPIVGLCQINRSVEEGQDKKPRLSNLRDSGRIEEDADCVILIYRPSYYNKDNKNLPKQEMCTYIIAKCRNGRVCDVDGLFEGEYMKFS